MKRLAALGLLALATGCAFGAQRPIVVELFTSLACSDCPPADLLLANVGERDPGVLVLDLHVGYWNSPSWTDPYSLPEVDQLQREYAALQGEQEVYTPEAVVDGQQPFIGSDAKAMAAALDKARARVAAEAGVPITLGSGVHAITVKVDGGSGRGIVWLFGFDPEHTTAVNGGENTGATIREVNVVRSITRLGRWQGQRLQLNIRTPAGKRFAVIVQRSDGTILGAASTPAELP
jgi:hypothetical protein